MNRPAPIEKGDRRPLDHAAYLIATGAGAGRMPIAPGTFGALEGMGLYLAALALPLTPGELLASLAALNALVFAVGVWASGRTSRILGLEDPSQVVIDEVSGQLIALTPLALAPSALGTVAAFLLFRLFDIFKPYAIGKLERLHGGFGVMMDDALAGVYAAALCWAGIQLGWL